MKFSARKSLLVILTVASLAGSPDADAVPSWNLRRRECVRIWKGTGCHASGVTLTPYLPADDKRIRTAVIVCPGGSYFWLDEHDEGVSVAEWLQEEGIAAFVLRYRTGGGFNFTTGSRAIFGGHRHPDMLCDIQRAIQIVRENAEDYGIDPARVGVMGFSAGGHLVMSAGEYFDTNFLSRYGIEPEVSLRPDFCCPIYPVVTLSEDCTHKRSRRGLLGEQRMNRQDMRDSLSLEKHVRTDTPPTFLMNCVDDPIVDYRNSELLDEALTKACVPHLYTQYKTGGHGFGANKEKQGPETSAWQELFISWLQRIL